MPLGGRRRVEGARPSGLGARAARGRGPRRGVGHRFACRSQPPRTNPPMPSGPRAREALVPTSAYSPRQLDGERQCQDRKRSPRTTPTGPGPTVQADQAAAILIDNVGQQPGNRDGQRVGLSAWVRSFPHPPSRAGRHGRRRDTADRAARYCEHGRQTRRISGRAASHQDQPDGLTGSPPAKAISAGSRSPPQYAIGILPLSFAAGRKARAELDMWQQQRWSSPSAPLNPRRGMRPTRSRRVSAR